VERDEPRYNVGRKIPAHCASGANAERVAIVWWRKRAKKLSFPVGRVELE